MYLDLRLNLADDASVDKKSVTAFLPILEAVYVTFLAEMTIPDKQRKMVFGNHCVAIFVIFQL